MHVYIIHRFRNLSFINLITSSLRWINASRATPSQALKKWKGANAKVSRLYPEYLPTWLYLRRIDHPIWLKLSKLSYAIPEWRTNSKIKETRLSNPIEPSSKFVGNRPRKEKRYAIPLLSVIVMGQIVFTLRKGSSGGVFSGYSLQNWGWSMILFLWFFSVCCSMTDFEKRRLTDLRMGGALDHDNWHIDEIKTLSIRLVRKQPRNKFETTLQQDLHMWWTNQPISKCQSAFAGIYSILITGSKRDSSFKK